MSKPYQLGSDDDWLKHSNDELARMVRKRDQQIQRLRFLILFLLIALTWVLHKFSEKSALEELWRS